MTSDLETNLFSGPKMAALVFKEIRSLTGEKIPFVSWSTGIWDSCEVWDSYQGWSALPRDVLEIMLGAGPEVLGLEYQHAEDTIAMDSKLHWGFKTLVIGVLRQMWLLTWGVVSTWVLPWWGFGPQKVADVASDLWNELHVSPGAPGSKLHRNPETMDYWHKVSHLRSEFCSGLSLSKYF